MQARIEGRTRRIAIARHGEMALAEARRRAREMLARILPAFAARRVDEIDPEDVAAWFDAASRTRTGAANRALEILRVMVFWAERWGWRTRGSNPCLGIRRNPRNRVARFLDTDEIERIGRVLDARPNGPRPSPRSGCSRSPGAGAAKC